MAVTILSIIQVLSGAVLILFVLGQSGKHSGLGILSCPKTRQNPLMPS